MDTNPFWLDRFNEYADQTALIWRDQECTYGVLRASILRWMDELCDIPEGAIVGLESDFSPQTVAILFALIEKNCIIAPFDFHYSDKNKRKFDIAQLDLLITVSSETKIDIQTLSTTSPKNELYEIIRDRNHPGLVLFTSGSSGEPKGALHDLSKLLVKFTSRRKSMCTINFLLFDHWGGLNTLFHILSNGGCVVTLENRTADYVCEMIQKHGVELLPTSPTFLNLMMISRAYERYDLSTIKVITYGAEPMPETLLKSLVKTFPEIKFQQTYGLIELGVMRSKSENNDSLWVKIGGEGFDVRVVDGLLEIKADSAMLGYLNAPSPFTKDGWFMTGDSVEVKGDYFRILGRKSELINVGGEKVYPQEVENLIMEIDSIEDVLVYPEENSLTGKIVCAKVSYRGELSKMDLVKLIKTHCRLKLQNYKIPVKINVVDYTFGTERFKKERIGNIKI